MHRLCIPRRVNINNFRLIEYCLWHTGAQHAKVGTRKVRILVGVKLDRAGFLAEKDKLRIWFEYWNII